MLPKPEKTKTEIESKEISASDKAKQKRRILIVIISLTIGLSSLFSLYNYFKNFQFIFPSISPPQVSLFQNSLKSELKTYLKSDFKNWSFDTQDDTSPNFIEISSAIERYKQPLDSNLVSLLPQGLKYLQYKENNRYQLIIITPDKKYYLDVSFPQSSFDQLKNVLPIMYWSLVTQSSVNI